jgi:hypothetical protein
MLYVGGWNNNPTTGQFTTIFRRLLARCGLSTSSSGNVTALDDTAFVCAPSAFNATADLQQHPNSFIEERELFSHLQYSFVSLSVKALVENAVMYIAGWVVFKVLKVLDCNDCRCSLISLDKPVHLGQGHHLLELKNKGGLSIPSEGVLKVCHTAEKAIRYYSNISHASNNITTDVLNNHVLLNIGATDVFNLGTHIVDTQNGIDNHHFTLLRLVLSKYLTLRQHHIAKLHTLKLQGCDVRHTLTKTVLFKGQ